MRDFKFKIDPAKTSDARTVCEVHRKIYRAIAKDMPEGKHRDGLLELTAEAYDMAKRMSRKLEEYSNKRGYEMLRDYMDD